jgi:N-acetyl-anhydromuramyl-L-alanine amidase AmpD
MPRITPKNLQKGLPFMENLHYRKGRLDKVRILVIHTAETPKKAGMARSIMSYNQRRKDKVSCHEAVDNKEVIAGVRPYDTSWTTGVINSYSYSYELAGRASQTKKEWADEFNTAMLGLLAKRVAEAAVCWDIPVRKIGPLGLKMKKAGICGHVDATLAFQPGGHTDPGKSFPWKKFIKMVQAEVDAIRAAEVAI